VYLTKLKNSKTLFALKYVTRSHVKQFTLQKHIQQEKAVLEKMDHPFVLQFYRSFKDKENIYFLTEYIQGMELFDAIRIIGTSMCLLFLRQDCSANQIPNSTSAP
jgi:cGMP-dependent protein kinase